MGKAARPGEDRRDGVGRGRVALLVFAVMARHRTVRGFRFHRLAVGREQHRGHQTDRAEALRHHVGLHVVVVLARPDIAARPLERRRVLLEPCATTAKKNTRCQIFKMKTDLVF